MRARREMAASEAFFGSHVRGENDALSDRDYLIVDDDVSILNGREEKLKAAGLSVASFTFKKLETLAAKGALFLQHLKLESRIEQDRSGRLRILLDSYKPLSSYKDAIEENREFFRLGAWRPECSEGSLWAADVLHVAIRNHLILSLAQRQEFIFGFDALLARSTDLGLLSASEANLIRPLRFLKKIYRSGEMIEDRSVSQTVNLLFQEIPFLKTHKSGALDFQDMIDRCRRDSRKGGYLSLRNLERAVIAYSHARPEVRESSTVREVYRWVKNPRAYTNWASKQETGTIELLEGLLLEAGKPGLRAA